MDPLDSNPRWRRLLQESWTCTSCGEVHGGLPELGCGKPEPWEGPEDEKVPNSAAVTSNHFLSEDFCVLNGEHFFVRCVLDLPIVGGGGRSLGLGVWSTLAEKNFRRYVETFDSDDQGSLGPWFGWFSVYLKGYPDTRNLECRVHPRDGRQRPWIELEPTDHPLAREQREGITLDRVLELHALNGHDLARGLLD
jgi:hypothetical protein